MSALLKWAFAPVVVDRRAISYETTTPVSFKVY